MSPMWLAMRRMATRHMREADQVMVAYLACWLASVAVVGP